MEIDKNGVISAKKTSEKRIDFIQWAEMSYWSTKEKKKSRLCKDNKKNMIEAKTIYLNQLYITDVIKANIKRTQKPKFT